MNTSYHEDAMTGQAPDWGRVMEAVALEIMGEPRVRRGDQWRYGTHGSLVVNVNGIHAGRWRSWEDDKGGGVVDLLQYRLGLDRQEAWAWLQARQMADRDLSTKRASPAPQETLAPIPARPPTPRAKQQRNDEGLLRFAQDLWAESLQVSTTPEHPARRWMAARHLWRRELPLPSAVRWIPADAPLFRGLHQGAGSIAVLMAPPSAWGAAWPHPPELSAIHLVSVAADGTAALDRPEHFTNRRGDARPGLGKRLYGGTTGTVVILGNPVLRETAAPVRIIEGLADGLALAARFEGPIIAGIGTPARLATDTEFVAWMATAPYGIVIHADADEPGQNSARALRRTLQDAGLQVRQCYLQTGQARTQPTLPGTTLSILCQRAGPVMAPH